MNAAVSAESAEHYVWGEKCDGWHLLRDKNLSVIEERMRSGSQEQRHFHLRTRQFFHVLAGELTLELKGQRHLLTTGHGLEISPGEPHQALNEGGNETRFLVMSQPAVQGDRQPRITFAYSYTGINNEVT